MSAAVLTACGAPAGGGRTAAMEEVRPTFDDRRLNLGDGFDLVANGAMAQSCLTHVARADQPPTPPAGGPVPPDGGVLGAEIIHGLRILQDYGELPDGLLDVAPVEQLQRLLNPAPSTAADFANSLAYEPYSIYLVTYTQVISQAVDADQPKITAAIQPLVAAKDMAALRLHCGHRYVSRVNYGGVYAAVIRIATTSSADRLAMVQNLAKLLPDSKSDLDTALAGRIDPVRLYFRGLGLTGQDRPSSVNAARDTAYTYANLVHKHQQRPISAVLADYSQPVRSALLAAGDPVLPDLAGLEAETVTDFQQAALSVVRRYQLALWDLGYIAARPAEFEPFVELSPVHNRKVQDYLPEAQAALKAGLAAWLQQVRRCVKDQAHCRVTPELPAYAEPLKPKRL